MRLTPGALRLRLSRKFEHGLRIAWYRDVVRPRILNTLPIEETKDSRCEIHVLTSKHDWLNLIWTLKSFYFASRRRYALCIHEDGSLSETHLMLLSAHFPNARIIRRRDADEKLESALREFPRSLAFRRSNVLALKVFDFMEFLQAERMALFDSDLLFFTEPIAYLERIEDAGYKLNTFNSDVAEAYTVDGDVVEKRFGHELACRVNTGLGLVHACSIQREWIEQYLALPGILDGHFWRIEQTLIALCSSRHGVELLPDEYSVSLATEQKARCFRHYVGAIRHLMYGEGVRRLVTEGFLESAMSPT